MAYRFRSRKEIERHLFQKGYSQSTITKTVDYLTDFGYLDDKRFALTYGESRIRNRKEGKFRIRQELLAKGVSLEETAQVLKELFADTDETQLATQCAEKKLHNLGKLEAAIQIRRLGQYLQQKGFNSQTIIKVINNLIPVSNNLDHNRI